MAKRKTDPAIEAHREWIDYLKPTGLVVSPTALARAGAILDRRDREGQHLLRACLRLSEEGSSDTAPRGEAVRERPEIAYGNDPTISDFRQFARSVLGWSFSPKGYAGTDESPVPDELHLPLPDYGETLRPDFAVRELDPKDGAPGWQLLVRAIDPTREFDDVTRDHGRLEASAHGRMERLLRHTGVPAGLLFNGRALRLVSAPHGESSGWLDFRVAEMVQTAGRPISTALRLLLGQSRLLALPRAQRLAALLEDSRKYQNEVSERLAEQVLHALYELLRGFQAAHGTSKGELLRIPLDEHPDEVYRALLTVVLRLVFLLYTEERSMLPADEAFVQHYSLAGLYDRLREDAALYPDTMDQRYGAWAQLLVLFRMIHDGAAAGSMQLPRRHGVLFDPDRFPFLEGRSSGAPLPSDERIDPPLVPDGTIWRALEKLLVLDGERISYRALDVEQIGSVYETMMGFRLETATGRSIAIKSPKRHGAPTAIDLDSLLATEPAKRDKKILEQTTRKITPKVKSVVKDAATLEDLHAALAPVIDRAATPDLVPAGAMVLQPSEERRRSGSHYTPRALTEPIVRTTLEPILTQLRGADDRTPRPEALLDLKICDPAMGSGAFLVEACRQLGDALVESWHAYDEPPEIPPDEDEVVFARRLVAQRCLYGVDRNPIAVDLAKVSLWLVTLARDHALTFVDHALRHGDSLVGLGRKQIETFHWEPSSEQIEFVTRRVRPSIEKVRDLRARIRDADESMSDEERRAIWFEARDEVERVRLFGDLAITAFFEGKNRKEREAKRENYARAVTSGDAESFRAHVDALRHADPPIVPFHWEIEFPEVFDRETPGFDSFVGNPPYAGKNTLAAANPAHFGRWLQKTHDESHGNSDLVAHFFRRAFNTLRRDGTLGFLAKNVIAQGDTRSTGLRWICENGGTIYRARKRVEWSGIASVLVSVVHIRKGEHLGPRYLDNSQVDTITAFLFHRGSHTDPVRLVANAGKSFQGSIVLGMGFTFDDADKKGVATSIDEMHRLETKDPNNALVIKPFIGYAEVASSPKHEHKRFVINFGQRTEEECRSRWPDLLSIVETQVKPDRTKRATNAIGRRRAKYWWHFGSPASELYDAIKGLSRVLVAGSQASSHFALTFLPMGMVYSSNLTVIADDRFAAFAVLQSRTHEFWARFFMSTMKDDLAYTPTTCFEPFPLPDDLVSSTSLESAGQVYFDFRANVMIERDTGLTGTYNRFHSPEESAPDVVRLRELHAAMDRAVLDAYGWTDIPTDCEFLLDYEVDDDESSNKKKPWRYRWPDEVRDEVLARLLELNAERAREEARTGAAAQASSTTKKRSKRKSRGSETGDLFQ